VLDVKAAPDGDLPERASVIGQPLDAFLPETARRLFLNAARRLWETGQRQVFDVVLAEDGSRVYEVRMVPAEKGEALAILRDVTARKKADVAIAKLAAFPLNNPNPLFELSEQGDVLFANQTARDLADALGLAKPADVLPGEYPQLCRECLASGVARRCPMIKLAGHSLLWTFMPISESRTVHAYGFIPPADFEIQAPA